MQTHTGNSIFIVVNYLDEYMYKLEIEEGSKRWLVCNAMCMIFQLQTIVIMGMQHNPEFIHMYLSMCMACFTTFFSIRIAFKSMHTRCI